MSKNEQKTKKARRVSKEEKSPSGQSCKEELLDSEKRYEALLDHLPVGVYRTTPDGKIIEANQALVEILGCRNEEELKDVNVKSLYIKQKDRTRHLQQLESGKTHFAEFKLKCMDGRTIWGRDYPRAVIGASGEIEYYDGILVDITSQKMAEEQLIKVLKELEHSNEQRQQMINKLQTLSLRDDLTGLYNRRGFFTIAGEHLQLADRRRTQMFLLFMDLDNLKWINDTLGHHKGDEALINVAKILKKTFRKSDVKGRMGGDEFAIFPVDSTHAGAKSAEARLRSNIEVFNADKSNPFTLSVSMGIASYDPEHPCSIDELLVRADKLMYEEKRSKRDKT
ncbi:MAG: sensor domain-containing diguanylate cyclase [Candidatus Aminicenantes bacterium]|jgi:diguanylate cyclase (GGDEF)-like protein/PAS domain S-box-containing protein